MVIISCPSEASEVVIIVASCSETAKVVIAVVAASQAPEVVVASVGAASQASKVVIVGGPEAPEVVVVCGQPLVHLLLPLTAAVLIWPHAPLALETPEVVVSGPAQPAVSAGEGHSGADGTEVVVAVSPERPGAHAAQRAEVVVSLPARLPAWGGGCGC